MGLSSSYFGVDPNNLPPEIPKGNSKPTFDPQFGFEAPRKKRVMQITETEMDASMISKPFRGYCAHLIPLLHQCKKDNAPFFYRCKHELHHVMECQKEDFILRMKEYERERRLRLRQMKLEGKISA